MRMSFSITSFLPDYKQIHDLSFKYLNAGFNVITRII